MKFSRGANVYGDNGQSNVVMELDNILWDVALFFLIRTLMVKRDADILHHKRVFLDIVVIEGQSDRFSDHIWTRQWASSRTTTTANARRRVALK